MPKKDGSRDIAVSFHREAPFEFTAFADGVPAAFWITLTPEQAMKSTGPDRITLRDGWQRYLAKSHPGYTVTDMWEGYPKPGV